MENLGINKFKNLMEEKLNSSVDALKTKAEELGESSKNEEYVDKNEVEYEEEYSDNEYDEEEYQEDEEYDEEYDEEEYEDEDDGEHLSRAELELISTDYTEMISEDSIEELKFLLENYFKIKKIDPYTEEEKELKSYSEEVIRAILLEYEIPTDDLFYLFKFVLTLESFYESKSLFSGDNKKDIIFNEVDKENELKTLKLRIDEYLAEYPDLFDDFEIYDNLFNVDKAFQKLPTYNRIVDKFYSVLLSNPSFDSFSYLIELYNDKSYNADEYLKKMSVPSETSDDMIKSLYLLIENNSSSIIKTKIEEAKAIIANKYPDNSILKELLETLNDIEIAKKYKKIKSISLGVSIFLTVIFFVVGIIFLIAWCVIFLTPVHDKIAFLAKGRECYEATKNVNNIK